MKKKIISIFIIILILFFVNTIRNYIIIGKINKNQLEYENSTNYSYKRLDSSTKKDDEVIITDVYRKDNISIIDNSKSGKIWYNSETKEAIFMNTDNEVTKETELESIIGNELPFETKELSIKDKIFLAMKSIIISKKLDDEKCYYVINGFYSKTYYSQENGVPVKSICGTIVKSGKKYKNIIEIKGFKNNNLTNDDLAKPTI